MDNSTSLFTYRVQSVDSNMITRLTWIPFVCETDTWLYNLLVMYGFRLAQSIKVLVALSILFTYGLQFSVPSEIVWKKISPKIKESNHNIGYYIMRGLMILGTGKFTTHNIRYGGYIFINSTFLTDHQT